MIGRVTVQDAIRATADAVQLVDRMADQMAHAFLQAAIHLEKDPHHPRIEAQQGAIVQSRSGKVEQRVTVEDILRMPEDSIRRMLVLERAMENHYEAWLRIYPRLEAPAEPVVIRHWEMLLRSVVSDMTHDVEEVMGFLEKAGLHLDGHYEQVREVIRTVGRSDPASDSIRDRHLL
jgi:hypothetical protein